MADALAVARQRLADAASVCVLTGAGMSAESGIPTFRDAQSAAEALSAPAPQGGAPALGRPGGGTGLWSRFDPMQLASEAGFRADPQRVWDWYAERRRGVRAAQPNAGHLALAAYARAHPGRLAIVSQNVDDLHQRAGNTDTIRLHGDILSDRWLEPCRRGRDCATGGAAPGRPPRCAECGNVVRPGVVWFGEMLPVDALHAAERAARGCDVMLVVGTSGAVWPAAGLAEEARSGGAFVVIVNPQASDIDHQAHVVLRRTAAEALPLLLTDA